MCRIINRLLEGRRSVSCASAFEAIFRACTED
jgi:hypothetical protein